MGECGRVPEDGPGREERPDCRCWRPSLAPWALNWDHGGENEDQEEGKQPPMPVTSGRSWVQVGSYLEYSGWDWFYCVSQ